MDENNQKMSKSIGNVVSPNDVINGNSRKVSLYLYSTGGV